MSSVRQIRPQDSSSNGFGIPAWASMFEVWMPRYSATYFDPISRLRYGLIARDYSR